MNKREAKRRACSSAYALLNTGHNNEFLGEDLDGEPLSAEDAERMEAAWESLLLELFRRGEVKKNVSSTGKIGEF